MTAKEYLTQAYRIDQRINSLLQHTLFITYNNIRSTKLQKPCQTVVSINNTTIQII